MAEKRPLAIGMDVGSTTVKAVVVDPETKKILWSDYQRHHTKQPEKVVELLEAIFKALPDVPVENYRMFVTGSGAAPLCEPTGGKFGPGSERRHARGRVDAPRRRQRHRALRRTRRQDHHVQGLGRKEEAPQGALRAQSDGDKKKTKTKKMQASARPRWHR